MHATAFPGALFPRYPAKERLTFTISGDTPLRSLLPHLIALVVTRTNAVWFKRVRPLPHNQTSISANTEEVKIPKCARARNRWRIENPSTGKLRTNRTSIGAIRAAWKVELVHQLIREMAAEGWVLVHETYPGMYDAIRNCA